jgi:hypothetical protein
MLKFLLVAAVAVSSFGVAEARSHSGYAHHSSYHRTYGHVSEGRLTTHNHYTNVSGHYVHGTSRMIGGGRPAGASAHCAVGTRSFSEHARGTCSHHGGIG